MPEQRGTPEALTEALGFIANADLDYDSWIRIGMATADPVPAAACEKLPEDAAQMTLMVVEFQRWYREQREAANSR